MRLLRARRLTHAIGVMALAAMFVVGSAAAAKPSDGGRGGNPHQPPPTTTTSTTVNPNREATTTVVFAPAQVTIPHCVFVYGPCPYFTYVVSLSGRLTTATGVPIAGRSLYLATSSGGCAATTDVTGLGRCGFDKWDGIPPVTASGWFGGDETYAPSSGNWPA